MPITIAGDPSGRRARFARLIAGIAVSFAAVTCDLVTAPKPGEGGGIQVRYLGDTVLVVGQRIPLAVTVQENNVPLEGARVRLTTSDSNIVQVVDKELETDTIIVKARGITRIRATLVGATLGDNPPFVEVEVRVYASAITINDSTSVTFRNIGDTVGLRVSVYGLTTGGQAVIDSAAQSFVSSNPNIVTVDSRGRLTAKGNGTATITASIDSSHAALNVTVLQRLARYAYSVPTLTITSLNQDTVITVTPLDAKGIAIPAGTAGLPVPAFTSKNTGVATVATLSATQFRVSSLANDTTRVRIVAGTVDTTLLVTIGQLATSIVIQGNPADTIVALQDTIRLRARAFDGRNVEVQGRPVVWTSLNTAIVTVDVSGVVTGQTLGSALVTSRMDASLDTVTVVVRNLAKSITTSHNISLPTIGDSAQIAATVANRLGAPLAGVPVAWRVLDPGIASVDVNLGVVVARGVGTTKVIGSITGIAGLSEDTAVVAVENRIATVDIVQPDTSLQSIGDTITVRVDFRNARGANVPLSSALWSSSDPTVLSVSGGFLTALGQGFATIKATDPLNPARQDSVKVTVTNAPFVLSLNRVRDTLTAPSRTLQYVSDVRNARGALIANPLLTYRSTNGSIASVSPSGLATALAVGTTSIIAEAGTAGVGPGVRSDTAILVVTNDAVGLTVSPTDFTIASIGATTQLVADARNAVGGSVTGVSFTWTSSDPTVASVSSTGLVTGVSVGTVTISAKLTGLTATATVTVTNAPDAINIIPTAVTLASVNDSVTPAVTLLNALGAALPRNSAQWLSDDAGVAAVTAGGIIIATGRGVTTVRARNPINTSREDALTVTVTNAPDSINVVRTFDVLPSLNRTIQYTADVFNARRAPLLSEPVTWTVRNGSVASIASSGLATSVGIGSTYIVGSAGAVRDSALLTVTNTAASVAISPAAGTLTSVGQTLVLTATARNELGNVIAGPTVTWGTTNPGVAGVSAGTSASNTITATGVGTTTISATVDGLTNSITVNVTNAPSTVTITSGNLTLASIGDQVTPAATLTNSLGAALPRSSVTWSTSDVNVFTVTGSGVVTATGAGAATLTATSPSNGSLNSSITITVTNAPATLTIAPAGTTTLTSIGATATLAATVRNAAGAVILNPSPAVSWSSNAAAVTVGGPTGVVTAASNGSATITATAGVATNGVTVTTAQAASGARSTISAGAASITANGAATSTITVQLKDAGGTNLTASGGTVTMALTGSGTLGAVTNNANGTYAATLTAPASIGSGSVSASIGATAITTGDPQVSYVAGAATKYLVTSSSSTPAAGTSVTITAQMADANNNPVSTPARTVTWSATGGGSFGAPTSVTNASGIATVTFTTATTAPTTHNVTGTDNVAVTGTSAPIQTVAGAATNYLVTPATTSPVAGSGVVVTAQLRDGAGNAVGQPGQTVTWTKSNINGSFSAATSNTNASGVATITLTTHTVSGTATTVTATTGGVSGISGTVTTVPGTAAAATTTITTGVGTVTAGGTTSITVTARDANNNALTASGATVTLHPTLGSIGAVTDNGNGTYSATYTASTAGAAVISGTINGPTITATASVTVNPGAASAGNSVASVPTGSSGAVTTITVQAKDAFGNNRTTTSGAVTASVVGANTATGVVTDNANGTYTVTYTPTALGTDAIAITLGGSAIGGSPYTSVISVGGVASFQVEALGGGAIGTQTAGSSFNIRITARDAGDNVVTSFTGAGNTVTLTSNGTLTGAPLVSGLFTNGVRTSQAVTITSAGGATTITATRTSGGAQNGTSGSFAVNPGAANAAQSSASVPAGTSGSVTTITVQAKDAFGNNRTSTSGAVVVSVTGANTVSPAVTDNGNGTYTTSYTPTAAGTDNIAITLGGSAIGGSPYTSVVAPGALNHFAVTATGGGPIPDQTAGTPFDIKVTAQDASGNTVTGFTGTVDITSTGTLTTGGGTTAAFVAGVLSTHTVNISSIGATTTLTATRTSGGAQNGTSNAFAVTP